MMPMKLLHPINSQFAIVQHSSIRSFEIATTTILSMNGKVILLLLFKKWGNTCR
jgi:hypothetical protein